MSTIQIAPGDPSYPSALEVLGTPDQPPPSLYVRGRLPTVPGVAVVGTRAPTDEACVFARAVAAALVAEGIAVWSGGAAGVDAAAHEAALDEGGVTVLVSGGGLDRPYPTHHRPLFERILERGGALCARVPDGTPPMAPFFLMRNHVLAALTVATVVIQAGLESGARSTAAAARRLGRTLCVVPHSPWDERGRGCALELARGAVAIYAPTDVLAALGRPSPPPRPSSKRRRAPPAQVMLPIVSHPGQPADPIEAAIVASLGEDPSHEDEICERTGLAAPVVIEALLTLTLRSVVVEGPAGFFRRAVSSP